MKKIKTLRVEDLQKAAVLLREGELVAFPTETVYGLGAPIFSPQAIQKIFTVKQRPQSNPLIAHVANLEQVDQIAQNLPPVFFTLAKAFFPGPLTLIVEKKEEVPSLVSANLNTVAIRMPAHSLARALIEAVGEPLVAPSANLSGRPSSTCAAHVVADFADKIAAVIDGGSCEYGMESTVIDCVSFEKPTLLRLGSLEKEAIEKVLGYKLDTYTRGPKSSPGMQYRHYAPKAKVHVFSTQEELEAYVQGNSSVFVLAPVEAKTLYALLRTADEQGYSEVALCSEGCQNETVLNRLSILATH